MDTYSEIRNRIFTLCGERGIAINKLANIAGMSTGSLKHIIYGKSQNPKILTLKVVCDGLNMTLGEFFSTPEFDALEQEIK